MGPYGFSLALGVTGLAVMAILGFSHHGDAGGHAGHAGHGGHHLGDGGHHGHAGHSGHHGHAGSGHHGHGDASRLLGLLSPRVLFSFLVGAGATGLLTKGWLVEPIVAATALLGGVVFERFIVRPFWNFLFRFESRTATTLESAVMDEAQAVTDFDAQGHGLIQLELDGQVVQMLGMLAAGSGPVRVRRGDVVRIEDVDVAKNRCTVSIEGHRPTGAHP